jgi:hypothetical protein
MIGIASIRFLVASKKIDSADLPAPDHEAISRWQCSGSSRLGRRTRLSRPVEVRERDCVEARRARALTNTWRVCLPSVGSADYPVLAVSRSPRPQARGVRLPHEGATRQGATNPSQMQSAGVLPLAPLAV